MATEDKFCAMYNPTVFQKIMDIQREMAFLAESPDTVVGDVFVEKTVTSDQL